MVAWASVGYTPSDGAVALENVTNFHLGRLPLRSSSMNHKGLETDAGRGMVRVTGDVT